MRKLPLLLLILIVSTSIKISAQDAPTAAPPVKTFTLQQDAAGMASNSVNLFTVGTLPFRST